MNEKKKGFWSEAIRVTKENDPAARTALEVFLTYPGVKALAAHRISHFLWRHHLKLLARMHSQFWRFWTQIEIHPGAEIAHGVFIDGTGKDKGKRHPTIRQGALISAHSQLLGPIEVGENAKVGASAVVVTDVPPEVTVVGIPAKVVRVKGKKDVERITSLEEKREASYHSSHL
ncbi:MAG: serine acetyltransferase [Lactococcus lactis]|nr:serine acetyltransferase [Lactococcus lactis]